MSSEAHMANRQTTMGVHEFTTVKEQHDIQTYGYTEVPDKPVPRHCHIEEVFKDVHYSDVV